MLMWPILFPIAAGLAIVVQGGMNRLLADRVGLALSVVINSAVCLVAALLVWGIAVMWSPAAGINQATGAEKNTMWLALSGILGCLIVFAIPVGIARVGAVATVLTLIASQLVASMAWDAAFEQVGVSAARAAGCLLAVGGAYLALKHG